MFSSRATKAVIWRLFLVCQWELIISRPRHHQFWSHLSSLWRTYRIIRSPFHSYILHILEIILSRTRVWEIEIFGPQSWAHPILRSSLQFFWKFIVSRPWHIWSVSCHYMFSSFWPETVLLRGLSGLTKLGIVWAWILLKSCIFFVLHGIKSWSRSNFIWWLLFLYLKWVTFIVSRTWHLLLLFLYRRVLYQLVHRNLSTFFTYDSGNCVVSRTWWHFFISHGFSFVGTKTKVWRWFLNWIEIWQQRRSGKVSCLKIFHGWSMPSSKLHSFNRFFSI